MCGIYGMVSRSGAPLAHPELAWKMAAALEHRGPDGHGELHTPDVVIGCRRLRVIDLHERADQPFSDTEAGVTLACNGEIYNSSAIRARHASYGFRSRSDVESILPLYLERGVDAISELDGMFGLAIWDARTRALTLARDRAGEKPLFWAEIGGEIWFASEIQCLLVHPEIGREIDREALQHYLMLGYPLEPRTIFRAIRRIESGTAVEFREDRIQVRRYWDPKAFATRPVREREAVEQLTGSLETAVSKQLTSDVPVGVFTSGGLDSSLLAAMSVRKIGPGRVKTFSVSFDERSYDESPYAELLARSLKTKHVLVPATTENLIEALQEVTSRVAEPVADPAILPTFLLAREAKKDVTVVLSGEGADELFGGYPTYLGHVISPMFQAIPGPLQRLAARGVSALPSSTRKVSIEFLLKKFFDAYPRPVVERHMLWFGTGLGPHLGIDWAPLLTELQELTTAGDPLESAMLLDYRTYLRDNLLVKVDRATMLSSIEARAPFLDRDLTRFAFSVPSSLRVRRFSNKWLLKQAALNWLPREVVHRRKRGLSVPLARLINTNLRALVDSLLEPRRLADQGLVDPQPVQRLLSEHRQGSNDHSRRLWPVIVLQLWHDRWAT